MFGTSINHETITTIKIFIPQHVSVTPLGYLLLPPSTTHLPKQPLTYLYHYRLVCIWFLHKDLFIKEIIILHLFIYYIHFIHYSFMIGNTFLFKIQKGM